MADIARVKNNIRKMIDQGAPEEDIDAYVSSEGVTVDQLKTKAEPDPYRESARKRIDDLKAKGGPGESDLSRLAIQGATFNASDEILAGLQTPLEMIRLGTLNPVEGYKHAKAMEDTLIEDARKKYGAVGTVAEIGGGVLSGSGAAKAGLSFGRNLNSASGLGARSAASAGDAAVFGGLSGAMEGNSLEERGTNAAQGAAIGGAVGGATPAVFGALSTALSPIVSNVRARINPEGYARSQVARGVIESGRAPQQITDDISTAANEGQGMFTLADAMGNPGQRMLSATARAPGAGRTAVVDFMENRQAGQGRRIAGALAEGFDAPRTAAQTRTSMTQARDDAADVAYDAVRGNAAPVDLTGVIARIDDTLQPGATQIARPQSGIANDTIESALESVRRRLTDDRSVLTDFTAIQRVRGDLSDMIQSAMRSGQGNRARLLGQVARELDTAMENASSGFRQANRNFAQSSQAIDAIDEGATAARRGRPEDTIPRFNSMTPEAQGGFRTGYVDPLIEQTQGAAFGVNKARPLTNDAFRDEAAVMAPGNDLMQRRLGRENLMFETRNQALGGSKTADNLADADAMGVDVGMIGHVLSGNWSGALKSALAAGSNALSGNTPAVREEVARILLQRGQNVAPQQLQTFIDEAVRRIEMVSQIARQLGRGASAGIAVAPSATGQRQR